MNIIGKIMTLLALSAVDGVVKRWIAKSGCIAEPGRAAACGQQSCRRSIINPSQADMVTQKASSSVWLGICPQGVYAEREPYTIVVGLGFGRQSCRPASHVMHRGRSAEDSSCVENYTINYLQVHRRRLTPMRGLTTDKQT